MNINKGLRIQLASCVIMGILLFCIFSTKLVSRSNDIEQLNSVKHETSSFESLPSSYPSLPKHVGRLLEATKAAAREAAGGQEPAVMTKEEQQDWMLSNPCRSRLELPPIYARRSDIRDMAENPLWTMVMDEYAKLHRTCMQRVGSNLTEMFLSQNTTKGCKFAIADIDWGIPAGLSNRILSITSVILYSILTQRVVLLPPNTLMTTLMCEPFLGSSWKMENYGVFSWYPWSEEGRPIWAFHKDVYAELDEGMINDTYSYFNSSGSRSSSIFAASMDLSQYHPDSRFFCDREQTSLGGVTWLYFTGCIYTIPKFFSIPSFRPTLEALFPGRFVLTQVLRTVMLPGDSVWERVLENEAIYFNRTAGVRRVGIQIRYYYGMAQYDEMNDVLNDRILTCAIQNGMLAPRPGYQPQAPVPPAPLLAPQASDGFVTADSNAELQSDVVTSLAPVVTPLAPEALARNETLAVAPQIGDGGTRRRLLGVDVENQSSSAQVFVASLFTGFYDHMVKVYLSQPPESGENVTLVQLSSNWVQTFGVDVDRQSLVEIFLLSFSDILVSTPISTFGGLAQAYGSLIPWKIETRKGDDLAPCERDTTMDLCYQTAEMRYTCSYNNVNGLRINDLAPYFQTCLKNLTQVGIQLVTDYDQEIFGSPQVQQSLHAAVPANSSKSST